MNYYGLFWLTDDFVYGLLFGVLVCGVALLIGLLAAMLVGRKDKDQ